MKKKAKEIKAGDKIKLAGKSCTVDNVEISDIGKQGVRPEDYPIDSE